jgi:hypothetical protein
VGGHVEADPEVLGATPGDKVEDGVGCLPPLPLIGSLCGGHGTGLGKVSMSSCYSKLVSPREDPLIPPPPPTHQHHAPTTQVPPP